MLRSEAIAQLMKEDTPQPSLFDERNLFEITPPDYPGERLVACRNLELTARRANPSARPCSRPPSRS